MYGVSLFSGVGGFELGFQRAGIRTVLQVERDPWCLSVLARHWPDVERVTDVRGFGADAYRQLRQAGGQQRVSVWPAKPDLVYGGFPCIDVSLAGKRAGLGGSQSGLWFEFRRVLSELRPRWAVIENVPGLASSSEGEDLKQVVTGLADLGYGVAWREWDAQFFLVPQRRRRIYIVACGEPGGGAGADAAAQVLALCESCGGHSATRRKARPPVAGTTASGAHPSGFNGQDAYNDRLLPFDLAQITSRQNGSTVREGDVMPPLLSGGRPALARSQTARQSRLDGDADNFLLANTLKANSGRNQVESTYLPIAHTVQASAGHHGHSSPRGDGTDNLIAFNWQSGGDGRLSISSEHSSTLHAGQTPAVSGPTGVRRLSPLECERLMSWPDEHTRWTADGREIPDTHRYRMCGNGVVSTVAEWLGWRLLHVDRTLGA